MKKLENQTAIITGSSSGIGQGIAIEMAKEGANICINYLSSEEGAEETQEEIEKVGGKSIIVQADTSKPKEVSNMFEQTIKAFGTVDIVVSNAGVQKDASFLDMSIDDWKSLIDINLNGQFICAKEAAKEFLRRGIVEERSKAAGKIICMSSVHDIIPWGGHINYATSKAGILMFVKTLAQELGKHKIRVNALSPGAIKTKINEEVWKDEESREKLLELIPYQRIGEPEDIGKAAVWLASDDSDYVQGQTIYVDGGMTLYPGFSDNG
ncbi:glucose 1-dehydrogenase [Fulvivirga ligni]|uniref:glucose 1-dehydrogenase n=1 Tax=Fulvivirga ligni TaxID=2904246 RepID=UPI001F434A22|nr:glucose 1-dehydrogenase [Fulvivirga ligni]UII20365.1 glucose 1-dehydrogenase [Fulvivirga ligni]